jgi:serine protease AprX
MRLFSPGPPDEGVLIERSCSSHRGRLRSNRYPVSLRALSCSVAACVLAGFAAGGAAQPSAAGVAAPDGLALVVRAAAGEAPAAAALVRRIGGEVTRSLPIVDGFAARVPAGALPTLTASPAVAAVWPDTRVRLHGEDDDEGDDEGDDDDDIPLAEYDELPPNELWQDAIGLTTALAAQYDGDEVAVAVLDTGVARVPDLEQRVALRVDFTPGHDGIDRFGHGTHMAGIVAGDGTASSGRRTGVASGADVVALKVAGPDGATDTSVVIAALQWLASHADRHGVRVLNLSFGTDARQSAFLDPLNLAVHRVWDAGILVVVSVGNAGPGDGTVRKPGDDPVALTVGAADLAGTADPDDDRVAEFSSRGPSRDGVDKPDLVAPGISIVSLRVPDSTADRLRAVARVDADYFKGTGSSQAAAVVSGVAALLFDADPTLTPEEARAALVGTAGGALAGTPGGGAGLVDADEALAAVLAGRFDGASRSVGRSSGLGALDGSRGSAHVNADPDGDGAPQEIAGEYDVLGRAWEAQAWSAQAWSEASWELSPWAARVALSAGWEAQAWSAQAWSGMVWEAQAWSSRDWGSAAWVAQAWSAQAWSTWGSG